MTLFKPQISDFVIFVKRFLMATEKGLTNLQLELLKVFSYELNEQQLKEVRALLSRYFAEKATQEMDKLWEDQNWSDETMMQWSNEHLRSKSIS